MFKKLKEFLFGATPVQPEAPYKIEAPVTNSNPVDNATVQTAYIPPAKKKYYGKKPKAQKAVAASPTKTPAPKKRKSKPQA